jgi:hypothetical protein
VGRVRDDPRILVGVGVVDTAAGAGGEVVLDVDPLEPQDSGRPVLDRSAVLRGERFAEGQIAEGHMARGGMDLEQTIEPLGLRVRSVERPAAVEDRRPRSLSLEGDGVVDVVVAGLVEVVVDRRDLELVDAGQDVDRVVAGEAVGLLDRGSDGARAGHGGAEAVADVAIGSVGRVVDGEAGGGGGSGAEGEEEKARDQRNRESEVPSGTGRDRPSWLHTSIRPLRNRSNKGPSGPSSVHPNEREIPPNWAQNWV